MNQTVSRPTTSPAIQNAPKGFNQMATSMKTAISDFKSTIEPNAVLAAALTAWKPIRKYGAQALRFTSVYTRRHPVRMAISVIALGFVASRLLKANSTSVKALKESL